MTAATELGTLPEFDVVLTLDKASIRSRVFGLAIANGRFVGGGFTIARDAYLDDGFLDVVVVPVLPTMDLLAAGLNYVTGLVGGADSIRTFKARSVSVTSAPPMPFSIDGESKREVEAAFDVIPHALRVVPGPQAPALSEP